MCSADHLIAGCLTATLGILNGKIMYIYTSCALKTLSSSISPSLCTLQGMITAEGGKLITKMAKMSRTSEVVGGKLIDVSHCTLPTSH